MEKKVNILGVNKIKSHDGKICLFGFVACDYDINFCPDALGVDVIKIQAFGDTADNIYKKIMEKKLLNKDVVIGGDYSLVKQNNSMYKIDYHVIKLDYII